MSSLLINGLPTVAPQAVPPEHQRWGLRLSTLKAVAELCEWVQQHLGLPFDPALVEVLGALEPIHQQGRSASVAELAAASRLPPADVERVIVRLAGAGALRLEPLAAAAASGIAAAGSPSSPTQRRIQVTPRLAQVLAELRVRLDASLVARRDLRERHLVNRIGERRLAAAIDALYDRFHELEWLHLHNWGSSCYLMAPLVAGALGARGIPVRVQTGYVEALRGAGRGLLGAPGTAKPGQVDGHAFCIVDERAVVDFGLGNARRSINRDFFWGAAMDLADAGEVVALLEHPRVGRVLWHTGWSPPEGEAQLAHCRPLAQALLRENGFVAAAA